MTVRLRRLTRPETESLAHGRAEAPGLGDLAGLADLLPDVVLRAALDNAERGFPWALCAPRLFLDRETGGVVGSGGCFPVTEHEVEIGYGTRAGFEGRGVATHGVRLLVRALRRDHPAVAVVAKTSVANPASGRVLEKNGFRPCGTRHDPEDGELRLWRRG